MSEFIRANRNVRVNRLRKQDAAEQMERPEKGRAVRLYCQQHGSVWNLQVLGPLGIGGLGLRDSNDFIIATASLDKESMLALRDAITAHLED